MNKNHSEQEKDLTPREIVLELDRYIIGQKDAKRAVSIALRNRWRRLKVTGEMREEITPKNIIMIGPTGVGKTEIARRLAKLANAPFYKVEASKFTEVGYVGKDVESMVRDLVEIAVSMVRDTERERVKLKAAENAEERLLDLLLPRKETKETPDASMPMGFVVEEDKIVSTPEEQKDNHTREKLREMLKAGKLDDRKVEIDASHAPRGPMGFGGGMPMIEIVSAAGSLDDISNNIRDMIGQFAPPSKKTRRIKVSEAREMLVAEETMRLIDMETVSRKAIELVENKGIIFVDEIDKIASRSEGKGGGGPDVSREGVQRDILPIVEGCTVSTKYGFVKTNHVLFIASGAFHVSKPSDLIPELQGRFPIRVELNALNKDDFLKILTEPKNSLIKQYQELMKTESVDLVFTPDALVEIASLAAAANDMMENIGARRLHTIMERVMDEVSFDAHQYKEKSFKIDGAYVKLCLKDVIKNQDLSQYIL